MKKLLMPLLLLALPAIAQVPSGPFTYTFTNPPLWDFSGTYHHPGILYTGQVTTVISETAVGKITGQFVEADTNEANGDFFNGAGTIHGLTFWTRAAQGLDLGWSGDYQGTLNKVPYEATMHATGVDTLDPNIPALELAWKAHWCIVHGHCTNESGVWSSAIPDLPEGMTGAWSLKLDIVPAGNRLPGSAVLTLSNGRTFDYLVGGRYHPVLQYSVLTLLGTGDAARTSLTLTTEGTLMTLTKLSGNVLGQKLKFPPAD